MISLNQENIERFKALFDGCFDMLELDISSFSDNTSEILYILRFQNTKYGIWLDENPCWVFNETIGTSMYSPYLWSETRNYEHILLEILDLLPKKTQELLLFNSEFAKTLNLDLLDE